MDSRTPSQNPHALLARQLRRLGLDAAQPPQGQGWTDLLHAVSRAYQEHDQDRYLLERAQAISSDELTQQADALRLNQQRLASLLLLSSDWVWEQDADLRVTYISEGWEQVTGIPVAKMLGTRRLHVDDFEAAEPVKAEFRDRLARREAFRDLTLGVETQQGTRFIRLSGEPLVDSLGRFCGYRGVGRDATEATLANRRAEQLARFDALTGLANRHALSEALQQTLLRARAHRTRVALAFLDLDGFKAVNDHLGHEAGDALLREVGGRLQNAARADDLVARLGGDEFVLVVERAGDVAALAQLATRLLEAIAAPVQLRGFPLRLNGSIGISVFPDDAEDADSLLRNADAAMYVAKSRGQGQINFYTPALAAHASETFRLENDLREAIDQGQLVLDYQPKFSVEPTRCVGVEALVRWLHPTRGLLSPASFVPLAERRGLIVALDRVVLAAACQQMRAWQLAGLALPSCAINISAHHFNSDDLVAEVDAALAQSGLAPQALEIELTESAVMADPERALGIMRALDERGVCITIDDFGTGHSSLAYLKRFPVRKLKIDRSFVRGLPGDSNDAAITAAVIAMAHSLGLQTVAEGVETPEQLALLTRLGCDEVQGYLLGRPMRGDQIQALLSQPLACAR